jgi:hypothetical protein
VRQFQKCVQVTEFFERYEHADIVNVMMILTEEAAKIFSEEEVSMIAK